MRFAKSLVYVAKMTDKIGIIEHSTYSKPNLNEGYTTDDNARAYQVMLRTKKDPKIYLDFLSRAATSQGFHNDADSKGNWVDDPGVGEWYGRAMAALAEGRQWDLFNRALSAVAKATSLRTIAQLVISGQVGLAPKLLADLRKNSTPDWMWFESKISHDNGRLPMALFSSGYIDEGVRTLDFLISSTWDPKNDCFSFIGNAGWWVKGHSKAVYDQQPLEAGSTVEACISAYQKTTDKKYLDWAHKAWDWYFGRNLLKEPMFDQKTGGVRDGLQPDRCNLNEGAEAVLSFILAGLALKS